MPPNWLFLLNRSSATAGTNLATQPHYSHSRCVQQCGHRRQFNTGYSGCSSSKRRNNSRRWTPNATTNPVTASSGVANICRSKLHQSRGHKTESYRNRTDASTNQYYFCFRSNSEQTSPFLPNPSSSANAGTNFSTQPVVRIL